MKKTIAVLTATRAEYYLLKPIIQTLKEMKELNVRVVVTGAHLSPEFGLTYRQMQEDQIEIDKKIEILLSSDTSSGISKSMGLALISFGEYFEETAPDALLLLGDRYETLAVAITAMIHGIPVIHLYGGDITEGAVDDAFRHCITKLSQLHLTSTEIYRKRVIQMGEHPDNVFTVGSIGVENIMKTSFFSREELEMEFSLDFHAPYALVTFHPVTLEPGSARQQMNEILKALNHFPEMGLLFTKANADAEGRAVNECINEYVQKRTNAAFVDSLGSRRYFSAIKYCSMVIGNSSSGLTEVPSFHVPTINIGERQRGRLQSEGVMNCVPQESAIIAAMKRAGNEVFLERVRMAENPYGDGHTSTKIIEILKDFICNGKLRKKKKFFDLPGVLQDNGGGV